MTVALSLVAILPAIVCPWFYSAFVMPKLLALAFAVFVGMLHSFKRPGRSGALDIPIFLCLSVMYISTVASIDPVLSILGEYNYYAYGLWCMSMIAGVYWLSSRAESGEGLIATRIALASGVVIGVIGLVQYTGWAPVSIVGENSALSGNRAVSLLGSPISFGAVSSMLAILCLGERTWWKYLALAGCMMGVFSSGSRASWVACAVGGVVFVMLHGLPKNRWIKYGAILATLVLGASFLYRVRDRSVERSDIDAARMEVWRVAYRSFKQHPFLGSGPDTFELMFRKNKTEDYIKFTKPAEYQAHAHNSVLQAMSTGGLLGLAALIVLVGAVALKASRETDAIVGSLAALLASSMFNPIPLEALALAALIAGGLGGRASVAWRKARVAGFVLSLASLCLALDFAVADSSMMRRDFRSGVLLNPQETQYAITYTNHLMSKERFDDALKVGEGIVRWHPRYSIARFCHVAPAIELARRGRLDVLDDAERSCNLALVQDPTFTPIIMRRVIIAVLRNDRGLAETIAKRYSYLQSLSHREAK